MPSSNPTSAVRRSPLPSLSGSPGLHPQAGYQPGGPNGSPGIFLRAPPAFHRARACAASTPSPLTRRKELHSGPSAKRLLRGRQHLARFVPAELVGLAEQDARRDAARGGDASMASSLSPNPRRASTTIRRPASEARPAKYASISRPQAALTASGTRAKAVSGQVREPSPWFHFEQVHRAASGPGSGWCGPGPCRRRIAFKALDFPLLERPAIATSEPESSPNAAAESALFNESGYYIADTGT